MATTDPTTKLPEDVPALLDLLGGVGRVSEGGGIPLGTVSAWKTRKRIPVENWPKIISLAESKGVSGIDAGHLMAMHAPTQGEALA